MPSTRGNGLHIAKLTIVSALALAVSSQGAHAQGARDSRNPTCPPLSTANLGGGDAMSFRVEQAQGRRVLVAEGPVDATASRRLESAIKRHSPIDEIWLRSPGGVAVQGPAIGRVIRSYGIPTRIPSGWWCVSACTLAFLGGPIRVVEPGGVYAVHMFTMVNSGAPLSGDKGFISGIEERSAILATEQNDYMIKMGVSRKLLSEIMYKQQAVGKGADMSTIRCMTGSEMNRYNVTNSE